MTAVRIVEYTDPSCPFGYNSEPLRQRMKWLYGDALEWELRMVGLSDDVAEMEAKGFTPELLAGFEADFAREHGMPAAGKPRPRLSTSMDACRAIVAARLHGEPGQDRLLARWLRIRYFGDLQPMDDPETIAGAARDAGIDPEALAGWVAREDVEQALWDDLAAARNPAPAAHALDHKLGGPPEERRYTCPSFEISRDGTLLSIPGFWPFAPYEVALANLAPEVARRADPESAEEVLRWADEPLATVEVAVLRGISRDEARAELEAVGTERKAGSDDGYWTLKA